MLKSNLFVRFSNKWQRECDKQKWKEWEKEERYGRPSEEQCVDYHGVDPLGTEMGETG